MNDQNFEWKPKCDGATAKDCLLCCASIFCMTNTDIDEYYAKLKEDLKNE